MFPKTFQLAKEKEKKKFPKFLKIFILFLFLSGGLWYLVFYSSIFDIKNIIVENDPTGEIKEILSSYVGRNLFGVNNGEISNLISQKNPNFKNVIVNKGIPDSIKVSFSQFDPKIVWQSQGKSFFVNQNGQVFGYVETETALPLVKDTKNLAVVLNDQVATENFINFILEINSIVDEKFDFKIINFEIAQTVFQVDAITSKGWYLKLDATRPASVQMNDLEKFLAEHKDDFQEYADLRVEGKVFFK